MTILGINSQIGDEYIHDPSAALIIDNKIVYAIEQERLSRNRYAVGESSVDAIRACLRDTGLQISDIDHIAYGWLRSFKSGTQLLLHEVLPPELLSDKHLPPIHFIQHHRTHAAAAYYTSGFDSSAVLVIDGRGEKESISLYHAQGNKIELIENYPETYSMGVFYDAAAIRAGLGGKFGLSGPGKIMGLAPFGQVRQNADFSFDKEIGRFTLSPSVQEKVDVLKRPANVFDMTWFWDAYYAENFYPYSGQNPESSTAHHTMHYVDLAASVQRTLENICQGLAERVKKLTGEKNLVLGGGTALNCSMNAYLSRQNIFENIYVFPGANDAGCSIGAALELSYTLNPLAAKQPRLVAPDFGKSYTDDEIVIAINSYGFTPCQLSPDELAEQVANDLANNKIIAWFQGRDEFGPRSLGRRSFMANPTHRENLGRLNKIKGREMWRPLAPSILDEQAQTVLEGSMERGLHRYMLGVATIRNEWRSKIPAVLHIDFTCRPHFVQQEHDGAYWAVIHKFYEKTGVPLVCNTSLNVAGQPIVHKPEEVLEVFATRDDVQTLVIEGFYLTKDKISKQTDQSKEKSREVV